MSDQASKVQPPLPRRTSYVVVGIVGLIAAAAGLAACPAPRSGPTAHPTLSQPPDTGAPATTPVTTARPVDDLGIRPLDCLPYNPDTLRTGQTSSGWFLTDGQTRMVVLDNEKDANAAKALAQGYTSHCFIGRTNSRPNRRDYIVEYWTGGAGKPGPIVPEDCISYQATALRIVNDSANGWSLVAGRAQLLILDNQQDAANALTLAKHFTRQCFIGRANTRPDRKAYIVQYWR